MLVAVGSFKGSPGATSAALAMAAAWPMPAVAVEADPDGGDLAVRIRTADGESLPERPSVLSLAADARSATDLDGLVGQVAADVSSGVRVVQGFLDPGRAHGLRSLWPDLAKALQAANVHVIVDVGRLVPTSAAGAVIRAADALVVAVRGELGSVAHLRERIASMAGSGRDRQGLYPLAIAAARELPAVVGEVAEVLDSAKGVVAGVTYQQVLGLAHDPRGLMQLQEGGDPKGRLRRTALLRSAREAAETIHDNFAVSGR